MCRLVVLGLVPMTVIISLNCCIYWAVRRARIQRSAPLGGHYVTNDNIFLCQNHRQRECSYPKPSQLQSTATDTILAAKISLIPKNTVKIEFQL